MIQRVPCKTCGDSIHPDTAAQNDGLCMPCKGGYRQRIEDGKKRREQERQYDQSPERRYWVGLVKRVHGEGAGFEGLAPSEKTYYATTCLMGEVYNGGFHQFFSNSSGSLYGYALDGLMAMDAENAVGLLLRAKERVFGDRTVPLYRQARNDLMADFEIDDVELNGLDKLFWQDPDKLGERCEQFARLHGLYS